MRPRARVAASATSVVLLGVGVLWLSGGLRAADTPRPVRPGQEVDQHLFHTELLGARVSVLPKTKYTQARRLLIVDARVVNPTRETVGTHSGTDHDVFSHGLFLYWNPRNGPRPKLVDAQGIAGHTLFRSLQPSLPTSVAVRYELAADTVVPGRLKIALARYTHTDAGVLDPRGYWEWAARRYEKKTETNPLTHRTARVTEIIPVLAATVTLPVRR